MTYSCLGIHKSSTVQRYRIYRLTKYIRHMFTTENPRETYLSRWNEFLIVKYTYWFVSLCSSHSPFMRGIVVFLKKGVNGKWRVATFMKSCDVYEKLRLIWKMMTVMESCDFYERWRHFWKIVTFPKFCNPLR